MELSKDEIIDTQKKYPIEFLAELILQVIKKYENELEIKPKFSFTVSDMCKEIAVEVDEFYNEYSDQQSKKKAIAFAEWIGDKDSNEDNDGLNPFIRHKGKWIQACGNSKSWTTEQLYELLKTQTMPNEIPQEIVNKIRHIADISNGNTEQERQLLIIFGYHLRDQEVEEWYNKYVDETWEREKLEQQLQQRDERIKELDREMFKMASDAMCFEMDLMRAKERIKELEDLVAFMRSVKSTNE